ncbi:MULTISPECIES: ATP-binding protein [unclassified Streptomyces]|uniref:ATP-binding protein n=1 Tax=unclassified Streptomyces TaxID=2593676 RepID=UPI002E8242A6|nr:ATP-binding protein [Streptomyces sp. NBC_00589]
MPHASSPSSSPTHGRVPGRDFHLTVTATESALRVEVTDTRGDRLPEAQRAFPEGESGRGLVLVEALADRWGVTSGPPPRKTVWAELRLVPEAPEGALTETRSTTSR